MSEMLSDSSSLQEILWNFCRFKDDKERLTLRDNPHFYAELPMSPEAYGDSIKIDPTEDFRHSDKFYVLTDKPELVYIMTDQELQSLGNFWCPQNAIIFKGSAIFIGFYSVSDHVLPDICGRLRGESILKASLRGSYCGFCKQLSPVSTVPRTSRNRRTSRELQPIITKGCPWTGWKCPIGCLPVHTSVDIDLGICTGRAAPNSVVRCESCDVIAYSTAPANIDIAPCSVATNV